MRSWRNWGRGSEVAEGWREAYDEQRRGLNVIEDVDDAVMWANALVGRIASADAIANAGAMLTDGFVE